MATTQRPDVSVLEYDRLETEIEDRLRNRQREIQLGEIVTATARNMRPSTDLSRARTG